VNTQRCNECGQSLPHSAALPLLDSDGHEDDFWSDENVVERRPARFGRWPTLAAVAIVGVGLVSWILSSSDDAEVADEPAITLPEVIEFEEDTLDEPAEVVPDFATAADVIETLGTLDLGYLVSYQSGERVVTVDLRTGDVWDALQTEKLYEPISNFALLSDGDRTMGVDVTDPARVFMITSSSHVVTTDVETIYSLMSFDLLGAATGVVIGVIDIAPQLSYFRIPAGSDQLTVPGLGVMVSPPTGGTYLVRRTGFDQVSEGHVLAATPEKRIEILCDDELACETVFVDAVSGSASVLPERLGASGLLKISPDNRFAFSAGRTGTLLFDLMRRDSREFTFGVQGPAVWAPDSSFVAWMQVIDGTPTLVVLPTDASEPTYIDLGLLEVGEMTGEAFTFFEPSF